MLITSSWDDTMAWKTVQVFASALLATAQIALAQGSAAPAPEGGANGGAAAIDPTGRFDVEVTLGNGQTGTGRLVISGAPGSYAGTLAADGGQGPLTVTSVTLAQDTVLVRVALPEGGASEIILHLKFEGPGFAGRFEGVESGRIKGSRVG
jgi:hypothetical protein